MSYSKKEIAKLIEQLLAFGLKNEMIRHEDIFFVRNQLLDILNIPEPWDGSLDPFKDHIPETATPILEKMLNHAA